MDPRAWPPPGIQSAGAGRDRRGHLSGQGAAGVHRLDLDSGEMSCLVEDSGFDFLSPKWPPMARSTTSESPMRMRPGRRGTHANRSGSRLVFSTNSSGCSQSWSNGGSRCAPVGRAPIGARGQERREGIAHLVADASSGWRRGRDSRARCAGIRHRQRWVATLLRRRQRIPRTAERRTGDESIIGRCRRPRSGGSTGIFRDFN